MKNILFLTYTSGQQLGFFKNIGLLLKDSGFNVKHVSNTPLDNQIYDNISYCDWVSFDLSEIINFKPDCVCVLNGRAREVKPALTMIKKIAGKMLYAERGWLPQADNMYIDTHGVGSESFISTSDLSTQKSTGKMIDPNNPSKGYIFIPLQLEHDSSIIIDSPIFKTMQSLVSFVATQFPNKRIIVKDHPLSNNKYSFEKYKNVHIDVSNKKSIDIAKTSDFIVGINSTLLIESLRFCKPVFFLGDGVLRSSRGKSQSGHVWYNMEDLLYCAKTGLFPVPKEQEVDAVLQGLSKIQFSITNPPKRIIQYFL